MKKTTKRRLGVGIPLLIVVLVAAYLGWRWYRMRPSDYEQRIPVYPASSSAEPSPAGDVPEGCASDPSPIVGTHITFDGHTESLSLLSLGLDAEGLPGTPPGNEGYTVAWWNGGPAVGSAQGKAVLTSHTFRYGGALGNDLNDGMLKTGDVIRISDDAGDTVCYRFTNALKIYVDTYDPDSDVLYDNGGDPKIVIVVCSDYPSDGGDPQARVLYYADLVRAA
ncbi:sortase family protein [Propionibacterium acidifaciens F0233]|uniref:Sortase family protein n=1 Tax=Propionibacterium acidifaciens F0233 TaxID=553198 RepID=U2QS46_9ACTN|nr:class F sortase [Propionibacterium acidifaciens]AYW78337.1 class F sortase [Propionibacterium acidifaciens]ERK59024.1 sortase family protein [Propionibacterium acidifaciens F0233]